MTQNNLYMEDDDLRLYVDVQPLFIDELENSKQEAATSAALAAQSAENAQSKLNNIISYKTNLELFFAQSKNELSDWYSNTVIYLNNLKNEIQNLIQTLYISIINRINICAQQKINSINTLGQCYVNQAKDYAEQAQSTVDNRVSIEHLNQSKALRTGSVSSDEDVLPWIKHLAHSTFVGYQASDASPLDPKKFIKVGSPVITNDGILNNPGQANHITLNNTSALDFSKPWEINFRISFTRAGQQLLIPFNANGSIGIRANNSSSNNRMELWAASNILGGTDYVYVTDVTYDFKYTFDGTNTYKIYSKLATENNYTLAKTITSSTTLVQTGNIRLGGCESAGLNNNGIYDLKWVNILVDGVPVFSGNKTGIDTIKPSNFTAITSSASSPFVNPSLPFSDNGLNITEDGVASGFSSSKYLNTGYTLDTSNTWSIKTNFSTGSSIASDQFILAPSINGYNGVSIQIRSFSENNQALQVYLPSNSAWLKTFSLNITGQTNTNFDVEVKYDGVIYYFYVNGMLIDSLTSSTKIDSTQPFLIGKSGQWGQALAGSIDLNAFKIFVDGDLVYQPCLKIPYTESKTGSKIVNSIYRDRVNDMASQFGYANYYTLLEENKPHYQVVGSPTISSDFVASNFSASNYINWTDGYTNTNYSTLELDLPAFTTGSDITGEQYIMSTYGSLFQFYIAYGGYVKVTIKNSSSQTITMTNTGEDPKISANTKYYSKLVFNGSRYDLYIKGGTWTDWTSIKYAETTEKMLLGANIRFTGRSDYPNTYFKGSIDLIAFKIYVDNKLYYEAVTNPNFTLPMGEIYGMIENLRKLIIQRTS